jgi:hypothetical protein
MTVNNELEDSGHDLYEDICWYEVGKMMNACQHIWLPHQESNPEPHQHKARLLITLLQKSIKI